MKVEKVVYILTGLKWKDWTRPFFIQLRIPDVRRRVPVSPGSGMQQCPSGFNPWPILFFIFVNDLPDVLSGIALLFADNVKLASARSQYGELHRNLQVPFRWSDDCYLPRSKALTHIHISNIHNQYITTFTNFFVLYFSANKASSKSIQLQLVISLLLSNYLIK